MKSVSGGCLVPKSSSLMSVTKVEKGMDSYVLVATSFGCARSPSSVAYLKYALYVTEDNQYENRLAFASENSVQAERFHFSFWACTLFRFRERKIYTCTHGS